MFEVKAIPDFDRELKDYLIDLELRISEALRVAEFDVINLAEQNTLPEKLRDGDVFHADGANFDPGGGEGLYFYNGATFRKL